MKDCCWLFCGERIATNKKPSDEKPSNGSMQVPPGFEPGMRVLQTLALPLGYDTLPSEIDEQQKILYNCQKFLSIGILYFYRCNNYGKNNFVECNKTQGFGHYIYERVFQSSFLGTECDYAARYVEWRA